MTPPDDERIARLEREQARLEQRVTDLDGRIREVLPLGISFAELKGTVDSTKIEIKRVGGQVADLRDSMRDEKIERGENRRGWQQFVAPMLAALIAALLALLLAGAHL
jgi:peptidoglycan hydrolase CwlO-like protein